jgi:AraC-like DNA-binding protein
MQMKSALNGSASEPQARLIDLAQFRVAELKKATAPVSAVRSPCATIRSSALLDYGKAAISFNLDPIPMLQRAGLDPHCLDNVDLKVSMRAVNDLYELSAATTGIDDFGLRVAEMRGLPDLGPVTLILREKETVRAALHTLTSFLHLHSDAVLVHLREGEPPVLAVDMVFEGLNHRRQVTDGSVGTVTTLMRWLLSERWTPVSVSFMHMRPANVSRYESFFRCPVDFNQEFNGIVLRPEDLNEKLPSSSPAIRRHAQRYLESVGGTSGQCWVHKVSQVIGIFLSRGEARLDIVARHLGIDPRTLNRRLLKRGYNFSAVLENVRRNTAVQHLRDGDQPLSDIAGLLGFSSLSAFSSWFHRAFDRAPSAWRKMEKSASGD